MPVDWDGLVLAPLHAAFGEAVFYRPAGREAFSLTDAVFDRGYIQVGTDDGGIPITAWATFVGVRLASCPAGFAPAVDDKIAARGATWRVTDQQPDGKGNVVLVLSSFL